ncbi:GntR family transcriptional regulator [Pseudonocardia nematodicida]|uniref:GntR family transcriptional regulator n=1 Tax=Pseudonocardia nematodicida TaxID=1206997 RepID=A0ABV1KJF0_9PSEU
MAVPSGPIIARSTGLEQVSLSAQALTLLRQAVVSGELRPGEIYSASALASELGVSNSPVREAMLALVNDGLMVAVRNRGYRVVPISPEELRDIEELRLMLEVPAMADLARRLEGADLAPFRKTAEEIVTAAEAGDITAYLERDREFHLGLLDLHGNDRLVRLVGNLRDQTRLYGLHGLLDEGRLRASALEHLDIVGAMESGDPEETTRLMTVHLRHITREWSAAAT